MGSKHQRQKLPCGFLLQKEYSEKWTSRPRRRSSAVAGDGDPLKSPAMGGEMGVEHRESS
ncbi:hypothetical protein KFK09_002312 [Dendrobium nobile]|uniref:Uncharacterized protein n=1 Tax=Dendrobium nobile TaxID=94219 RepID=A0A8T3CAN3_DENNO|nr:hypothetical protein KFK09_002312 [Dendrobium nobile]